MENSMIQLSLPVSDVAILKELADKMGWKMSVFSKPKKSSVRKSLDDLEKGNVYKAKNSRDLINQILE